MKLYDAISLSDLEHIHKNWRGIPDLYDIQEELSEHIMDMSITEFELLMIAIKLQNITDNSAAIKDMMEGQY